MLYFHQLFAYQVTNRMEYMACCYMETRRKMVKFGPFLSLAPPLSLSLSLSLRITSTLICLCVEFTQLTPAYARTLIVCVCVCVHHLVYTLSVCARRSE